MSKPELFHCLRYADADQALTFLRTLGFTEVMVVRDERDPSTVHHAQLRWRDNGGVMLGSQREDGMDDLYSGGIASIVVESDEAVDQTLARALEAGGTLAAEPSNPPHGGRTAGVLDHEGHYWNIDSYQGE